MAVKNLIGIFRSSFLGTQPTNKLLILWQKSIFHSNLFSSIFFFFSFFKPELERWRMEVKLLMENGCLDELNQKIRTQNHFSPVSKAIFQKTFILRTKVAQCPFIFQVTSVYYKHRAHRFLHRPWLVIFIITHSTCDCDEGECVHGNLQIHSCNPIALNIK